MKLYTFSVFLLVVAGVYSHAGHADLGGFQGKLNSFLQKSFVGNFQITNEDLPTMVNVTHMLFPNLTTIDPYNLADNTTEYDSLLISGHVTITDNVMSGFSSIYDALWLNVTGGAPDIQLRIDLPRLHIEGGYESKLSLLQNWVHFSGSGHHSIDLENFFVDLGIGLLATEIPTLEITRLDVDAGFQRLELQFENSELNCSPADWDEINQDIGILLEIYWPVLRDRIMPAIQGILNELIKHCNLNDLLEGNFDCITGGEPDPIPELIGAFSRSFPAKLLTLLSLAENPCTQRRH